MLSEDFSQHLDLKHYQSYAQDAPSQSQQQNIASENEEIKVTITNTQAGEFRGTLFDMEDPSIRKEPAPSVRSQSVTQEPLMTLYDLFGFTQEERSQVNKPKKRGKKIQAKAKQTKELPFQDWREEIQSNLILP